MKSRERPEKESLNWLEATRGREGREEGVPFRTEIRTEIEEGKGFW